MTAPQPDVLHHFCCSHSADSIRHARKIRPNPYARIRLSWFTDLPVADVPALGLTSLMLRCDRTEHRFTVPADPRIVWWPQWCRDQGIGRRARDMYESTDGAQPAHWWVAAEPIEIEVNR